MTDAMSDSARSDGAVSLCRFCGCVAQGFAGIGGERYCHEGESPTCYEIASRHIDGSEVTWHREKRISKRTVKSFKTVGRVTAVRRPPGVMTTETGRFRCIEFRIKPSDGSRAVWTHAFADMSSPIEEATE